MGRAREGKGNGRGGLGERGSQKKRGKGGALSCVDKVCAPRNPNPNSNTPGNHHLRLLIKGGKDPSRLDAVPPLLIRQNGKWSSCTRPPNARARGGTQESRRAELSSLHSRTTILCARSKSITKAKRTRNNLLPRRRRRKRRPLHIPRQTPPPPPPPRRRRRCQKRDKRASLRRQRLCRGRASGKYRSEMPSERWTGTHTCERTSRRRVHF